MIYVSETRDSSLLGKMNEEVQALHYHMYPDLFKPYNEAEIIAAFVDFLKDENLKAFVAYLDDMPAGYVLFLPRLYAENAFKYAHRAVYIDQILVLQQYRGRGVGKMLMDKVYEYAVQQGISRIELDHWERNSDAAIFFSQAGFLYGKKMMYKTL